MDFHDIYLTDYVYHMSLTYYVCLSSSSSSFLSYAKENTTS